MRINFTGKHKSEYTEVDDDFGKMVIDSGIKITKHHGYAVVCHKVNGKKFEEKLHQVIMNFKSNSKIMIDHLDGNKLNNKSSNLRITTNAENCRNSNNKLRKNICGYRYLSYQKSRNTYNVRVHFNKKVIYSAYFKDRKEAELVALFTKELMNPCQGIPQ